MTGVLVRRTPALLSTLWRYRAWAAIYKPARDVLQKLILLAPWSWTPRLENSEKIHFCCLGHPVCCIFLWQHKLPCTSQTREEGSTHTFELCLPSPSQRDADSRSCSAWPAEEQGWHTVPLHSVNLNECEPVSGPELWDLGCPPADFELSASAGFVSRISYVPSSSWVPRSMTHRHQNMPLPKVKFTSKNSAVSYLWKINGSL